MALSSMHHQRGRACPQRQSEVGGLDRFEIDLDHGVASDSTALGGPLGEADHPGLEQLNVSLQPARESFIEECRADDRGDDLVEVGQTLQRVSKRLFIDHRIG